MKKVFIRYVLVVCIVLMNFTSFGVLAETDQNMGNFSDVSENESYFKAVNSLYEIGIINGDENGNFNPDKNISRAETAKIICMLMGVDDEAKNIKYSKFSDVDTSNWACGYITKAAELGIINGYGNGKFGPKDQVTYAQLIKMVVCAWGYKSDAEDRGGWPDGYIAVAKDSAYLEGVSFNSKDPALRHVVATIIYNTLRSDLDE